MDCQAIKVVTCRVFACNDIINAFSRFTACPVFGPPGGALVLAQKPPYSFVSKTPTTSASAATADAPDSCQLTHLKHHICSDLTRKPPSIEPGPPCTPRYGPYRSPVMDPGIGAGAPHPLFTSISRHLSATSELFLPNASRLRIVCSSAHSCVCHTADGLQ